MSEEMLPNGWDEVELGSLGTLFRGRGGTRADEEANGFPCIRYGDLYTHHDCIIQSFCSAISPASASAYTPLQHGDVVFAGSGETFEEIGKAAVFCGDSQAYAGADTLIFRPKPGLDARFAGYAVNSVAANQYKSSMGQGSSVIHISAEHLARLLLRLPVTAEQQRIAEILSTVDEVIEQTEALIAKTQQIKAGLMHDLFTRGVTPGGQLRPTREDAPQFYKESPLGWSPKEWSIEMLACAGVWMSGGTPPKAQSQFWGGRIPWVTPKDMKVFRLCSTQDALTDQGAAIGSRVVPEGSIFIVVRGMILAHTFPVCLSGCQMAFNQDVKAIVTRAGIYSEFLACWFVANKDRMLGLVTEATHGTKRIDLRDLHRSYIAIPPADEQAKLVEIVRELDAKLDCESRNAGKLRQIKTGLMAGLLSGRVRVPAVTAGETKEIAAAV